MNYLHRLLVVVGLLVSAPAQSFVDPPVLDPIVAQAGQTVHLRLTTGQCDGVLGGASNPAISINGSHIDVLIDASRRFDPILCLFPVINHSWPLGAFAAGEYTVTVRYRYTPFGLPTVVETIGVLPLTVQGLPSAQPVPAIGLFAAIVLVLLVHLLGDKAMRRRVLMGVLALPLLYGQAELADAQPAELRKRVHVLLSAEPGAPTPEDVVEDWKFRSPPPTPGLGVGNPISAWYLLPVRARGDFKDLLDENPDAPRSKLERYIVVEYPEPTELSAVVSALEADSNIEAVAMPIKLTFSAATLTSFTVESSVPVGGGYNYGWGDMNIGSAWALAGGYGLVGIVDTGLATNHSELRAFTPAGGFTRGNFLPAYSLDIGRWPKGLDNNVDEREPEEVQSPHPLCPTDPNGFAPIDFVGHGTHVSGLVGANAYDGTTVEGVCKNCGIAMWRITYAACFPGFGVVAELNSDAAAAAVTLLGDVGAQVISQSFGFNPQQANYCASNPNDPFCLAFAYVLPRDIVLVAASGNRRDWLDFPARDGRVVAAGGFDEALLLWNEDRDLPPNHLDDCPFPGFDDECGSNYTYTIGQSKQEVVASSRQVYGVMYPGQNWNNDVGCGDAHGPGLTNDGYGNCTGTSMSSPQIAGVIGLLRSINPLVRAGDPENPSVFGVRDVLATTTFQAQAGTAWGQHLGYGRPDAAAAARRMLGRVAGTTTRNRATPLFGFYGAGSKDYSYTTSPNTAIAFLINSAANSSTSGSIVPGYAAFPPDPLLGPGDVPRAVAFILTTETRTNVSHPNLIPLYMLDRSRYFPVGCNPSLPSCNTNNRDFLLATGQGEIEALKFAGYSYRGIQGYVYERCSPEPVCIPAGAEKLWRKCKTADDDCAIFLESQRATFEGNGYTATVPAGFPQHIGYAYPVVDTDGDGLVDGVERVIGTSHTHSDTDGDGLSDGVEFPLAAVSNSDPCNGPQAIRCPAEVIFANGFQ